ncbi:MULTISPECIES: CooT family nickel-binding protein [unclassified Symbiopectobacterium]|uniref:CooT family nickel-binding protein n=1 Tax=unclassified Symbiopectobacterium TaxID=2794573 RepID=UPI002225DCEE|nr:MULTISPECIES: CooT family nickel-binding protein [unclassified Symbiopectobacterium]MCW2473950.1 CooT family nickel-binding protein [Candidatus Symbiopectobacterium sp. NZEC151]MCW2485193.1 CooT family nickel-binding protein [Candidatus Symbiopectobacterium sp. NZEC127]
MCQLRVRLRYADRREEALNDIAAIQVTPHNITLSALFEPPRELRGFDIQYIDSLRNEVLLVQRSAETQNGEHR